MTTGALLGWGAANLIASGMPDASGFVFILVCVIAGILLLVAAPFEQRIFWGRWFEPSEADLNWIGRSAGTKLSSSIPAPVSLGLALGMLVTLLV